MADETDLLAESDIEDATADDGSKRLQEVHERGLSNFDTVAIPQRPMREQALQARRFTTIPGAQWEGEIGEQFENAPRLEVDKIASKIEKIETDYRENRLTVQFIPGKNADPETAPTLDGMYRADAHHFKSAQAEDNAFYEGLRGGFGAWRLTTDYADPYDKDDDSQRVNPGLTIVDADQSVYFDPASILYDKSDAQWAFIITAVPRATAEKKWGAANCVPWPADRWVYGWDWYRPDVIQIAEYYEVEDTADKLLIFTQAQSQEEQRYFASEIDADERADLKAQGWTVATRAIKRRRVRKYIMNGTCVLKDCGYIAGSRIPIVPFYGKRNFVDTMERFEGYTQKRMDRQRLINTRFSRLLEIDSLSPFEKPVFDPTQIDSTQAEQWGRSNIDRLAYLTAHVLRNADGSVAQAGPSFMIKPPEMPPVTAQLLQLVLADESEEGQNVDQVKANTSVEAMDFAAARVDARSFPYLDNMRQSKLCAAEIWLGMAREVNFEEGRKVETLSLDGQDGEATLMEPYMDQSNVFRIRNDLTQGKFKVIADVQESTATARQKTTRQALELAAAFTNAQAPQDALPALYLAAQSMDGEGIQDLQAFYRNRSIAAGATKPTKEEEQQIEKMKQEQAQQPPAPADQALVAQTAKLNAEAENKRADSVLKLAQASVVGGPEKAPEVPSGLSAANDEADIQAKGATATLNLAKADHLRHSMGMEQVHAVTDLLKHHAQHGLAVRAQDHAEKQPKGAAK